jgi:hypothetical protein
MENKSIGKGIFRYARELFRDVANRFTIARKPNVRKRACVIISRVNLGEIKMPIRENRQIHPNCKEAT